MKNEEAIKILKYNSNVIHQTIDGRTDPKEVEALDMAIKALEKEPKSGYWIMKHRSYGEMKYLTGTDEMGIEHTVKKYESYEIDEPYCSECGKLAGDISLNFCSNCGRDMRERDEG